MNNEIANKLFPIHKIIIADGDFGGSWVFQKNSVDEEFMQIYSNLYISLNMEGMIEVARLIDFLKLQQKDRQTADVDLSPLQVMTVTCNKNEKTYPMFRLTIEEFPRGRDSGSSWSDPENDIVISSKVWLDIKEKEGDDWRLDCDCIEGWMNSFGITSAAREVIRCREMFYSRPKEDIAMFEYENTMFSLTYHFPEQKCVCGTAIDEHFYNDYEDNNDTKINYLKDIVFFYPKDELVIIHGRFYLNGKFLMDRKEFEDTTGFPYYQAVNMYPREVVDVIIKLFPGAKTYNSWSGWGKLVMGEKRAGRDLHEITFFEDI